MKYLQFNDIDCYKRAFNLSNYIWSIVFEWKFFEKENVGIQLVRSADSISANLAEGFGRFNKKDKIKFYYYSLGSVKEDLDWNEKSKIRELFNNKQHQYILSELQKLPKEIYQLIRYTNEKLKL